MTTPDIILASQSRFRAKILSDAGLTFSQQASELDERAIAGLAMSAEGYVQNYKRFKSHLVAIQ